MPKPKQKEFWDNRRIEHLRELATTGKAAYLWENHSDSSRILDRLAFSAIDPQKSNDEFKEIHNDSSLIKNIDTTTKLAYGRISLSAPLYLGDMSFGALSGIPNIALARASDATGVINGTGEGGLHPDVATCKNITVQWASGRFGVDIDVLKTGQGIVIKIGQGAKPGIGGHLPGSKVTGPISRARRIPIGKDAVSPAPHHDIYSIEDLGQRIWALKEATGKPVFVKIGCTNYVPYIASGVASMGADGIIIDGSGAGTGAAPSVIRDNVGLPIDLVVSCVDRILTKQNLRNGFSVIAAGGVSNAEDTAKLLALGADCVSTGTATLVGLGCLMVHKCHIGFCPALLTNKLVDDPTKVLSLDKSVEWTSKMIFGWIEEFKWILRELNLNSVSELVGRRDLLRGYNMHEETADILGVELDHSSKSLVGPQPIQKQIPEDEYWTPILQGELRELSGSAGRNPGEAVITSMGTITAPFVAQPRSVCDWIRSDGAQVTRPSIDPYREEIETSTYLANGDIRLSNPIYLGRLNEEGSIQNIFSEVSSSMGLLYNSQKLIDASKTSLNSSLLIPYSEFLNNDKSGVKCITVDYNEIDKIEKLSEYDVHIMVRFPSNEQTIKSISSIIDKNISGIIIDWDLDKNDDTLDLAICTSEVDNILRNTPFKTSIARNKINLLVEGSRIRGAADIFKLIGLGADAAGISKAALLSINYDPKKFRNDSNESNFDQDKTREKLEYTILALQKEIKLLAGAAGISSIQNSLLGNRELFRSVDLDPLIRKRLGIKAGGAL
ncbi:MAG TPA: FMN-binding glutamate synthase family protein [Nitrososphaerales archaeon]|nr:FMN-binding glutamate synthase family protein [Nitrososphaerales archaeon]